MLTPKSMKFHNNHSSLGNSSIGLGFIAGANLLLARILGPYFQKTTGIGIKTTATKPRSVPAQFTCNALNIYILKSGKIAPARDRRKVFAAMADAALCNIC